MNALANFIKTIQKFLPADAILTDPALCIPYGKDSSDYAAIPKVVLLPTTTEQVASIMVKAYEYQIPVTTRGLGSGTTGAAVPLNDSIVLSLEKMNQILKLDIPNRMLKVQAGILNESVQNIAKQAGFFWAPDPGSAAYSSIGGNLACNAAGPRAVKYGTCRENTLALTAVLADGRIIYTGSQTTKNAVGYDLTRLLIGSEGTLAIITEATLKLLPLPEAVMTFQLFYDSLTAATNAITAIMNQPAIPCALEFLDNTAIKMINRFANLSMPETAAMLIVEVDGLTNALPDIQQAILTAAKQSGLVQSIAVKDLAERQAIWQMRKSLSPALKIVAPKKINEDIVVPVANIPILLERITLLAKQYHLTIVNFGHAGNGNIHVNIMIDPNDAQQTADAQICLAIIFDLVIELNGSLSGEHGIGIDKMRFMQKALDVNTLTTMQAIKNAFDPKHLLNPGKVLPPALDPFI